MRVAVIGGGIAGASVAYELADTADVTLFEQESVCGYHSTGRSAAVFTECYGDPVVRRLAIASRGFLESPPEGFTDGPLVSGRSLLFAGTDAQGASLERALRDFRELVPTVEALTGDQARELCPVLAPTVIVGGVLEPNGLDLDVHALHLGYQRGARARGARILTDAQVSALERGDGVWRLTTNDGDQQADVVVDAAGAWADIVGSMAGAGPIGLVPKRRTAFTFRPPAGADHRAWPMVVDIEENWYFRPEGAHVLGSPADETPMEAADVRHEELDVALGIERINDVTSMGIRSIDHAWAGLRSFVADHRPVNGWDTRVEGFFWLAGQGGYGIKTAPAMARYAAAVILEGDPPPDLADQGLTPEVLGPGRFRADRP